MAQNKKAEMEFHEKMSTQIAKEELSGDEYVKKIKEITGLDFEKKETILDAGCGIGRFGCMLASEGYNVVGLDISHSLLKLSRSLSQDSRFMAVVGDLEMMPFRTNYFGACICIFVLHHFAKISTVCSEFSRVLRDNSKILLIDTNGSNPYLRISRKMGILVGTYLEKIGRASRNEESHTHLVYLSELENVGFKTIDVRSHHLQTSSQMRLINSMAAFFFNYFMIIDRIMFRIA